MRAIIYQVATMDWRSVATRTQRLLAGAWLFFVSLLTIFVVVFSLTAFQVQSRMQSFTAEGQSFTVFHLQRVQDKWREQKEELKPLREKAARARDDLISLRERLKIITIRQEAESPVQWKIIYALQDFLARNAIEFRIGDDDKAWDIFLAMQHKLREAGLAKESEAQISEFQASRERDLVSQSGARSLASAISSTEQQVQQHQKEFDDARSNVDVLFGTNVTLADSAKNKILDLVTELDNLETRFSFIKYLTRVPNELLIIVLVLCMGALGSSIHLTQLYFARAFYLPLTFLMFRQILGGLAALALFIVLKAGVIVAVDPRSLAQAGADLNPFLIAFLAIIGGLLSEQAVERIRQAGQDWLTSARVGRQRYARGVSAEMTTQGKTVDDLAKFFGGRKEVMQAWIGEDEPVPPTAQAIIAAWLNKPERELFSDLPKTVAAA